MPALMHVVLDSPRVVVHPKWLHGAACELFEGSDADHHAQDKPFSVGPVRGISGGAQAGRCGASAGSRTSHHRTWPAWCGSGR